MHCVVMFLRRALVVALAAALSSGTALAQANQVRLTGKITDKESGQPIPFAQIQIVVTTVSSWNAALASTKSSVVSCAALTLTLCWLD